MANESKFKKLQQEPCDIVIPEEKPIDRVCPTCIPNPSYTPPKWWKQTEPWLNEKTCEYSVAVFINQNGDSYRLSDLKGILDPDDKTVVTLSPEGYPIPRPATTATFESKEKQEIKNDEKFDRIKRSFVKPGIRTMLRHYGKLEKDELVCGNKDCSIFTTTEAKKFIRQRKHYASLNSDVSFYEWARKEQQDIETLPTIENPNALELFASSADYHFYGGANGVMAVLITIPAHIFDQVPKAPVVSDVDTNIESVRFKVSEFTAWIAKMEAVYVLFSKYQAYFKHAEEARLFHLIEGEETPFYAKFMQGRFEKFETSLSKFIELNGYEYYSPLGETFNFNKRTIKEIELKFDKSDENKPFKLADTIIIKPAKCDDITLNLGPEPNDKLSANGDSVRKIAFRDQTLMAYIANYVEIKKQLEAKKNPPWIDFLVEHTYPALSVNYGSSMEFKSNAIGCLLDKFSGLDDFILNETMSFFESLSYQWNKNNCRLLADADKGKITVFDSGDESQKKLDKAKKEQKGRQTKESELFGGFFKKKKTNTEAIDDKGLSDLLTKINPCNWKKLTLKAIQCLMSGMSFEEGMTQIIKSSIGSLTTEGMEILLSGLPADKQQKVRETIEKEFKDLPAPWEVGYDPGDIEAAYDRQAQENINQAEATYGSYEDLLRQYKSRLAELERSKSVGPDYDQYLSIKENKAVEQQQNIAIAENKVNELKIQAASASGQFLDAKIELLAADEAYQNALSVSGVPQTDAAIAAQQETINIKRQARDNANTKFQEASANEQKLIQELFTAEGELEQARSESFSILSKEQYNAGFEKELAEHEAEVASLKQQLDQAQQNVNNELERNPNTIGFSQKTPEEQAEIIAQEKEKSTFVSIKQGDKIRQGTYGRAVGNIQKELMTAYGDAIIQNASVQEIMDGLDRLPGASIIGELFASFDCPKYSFAYPPISEFLGTFTVGACGKGKTRPFSLPAISTLPSAWSIWDSFYDALLYAFKKTVSQIISTLILKTLQTIEEAACKTLSFAGESIKDATDAAFNGGRFPRSFSEIISDVICADQLNDKEKKNNVDKLFSLSGSPQRGTTTPQEILETMSTLGSEQDYLKAMVGEGDKEFLENVSRTLEIVHPDYDSLSTPEGLDQMLQSAGNYLSEEQRQRALELSANPQQFFPLDPSICLTNDQAERYYRDLTDMFTNQIGDPNIAEDFVNNQRDRARSDLGDLSSALAKGPEGLLQDEINNLFAEPDPDCSVDKSLLKTPEEVKKLKLEMSKGIFSRLQNAFLDDTVQENPFEFTDSVGILLMVTADIIGYNYTKHYRVRNNLFFRFLSAAGLFDNEAPFPETVGSQMRQKILDIIPDYGSDSKIAIEYTNGLSHDEGYSSEINLQETYPVVVEAEQYHNNSFNYLYSQNVGTYLTLPVGNFIVENIMTAGEEENYKPYYPPLEDISYSLETGNTFRNYVLKNYLQDKLSSIIYDTDLPLEKIADMVTITNNILFGEFKNTLVNSEDGNMPNSFIHGGADQKLITVEDLTYVDPTPNATEYTHDEEDAVLGRSLTNNSRVKFLDPLKHGATFESPNIYIEPDLERGWLSFTKLLIPNVDGCNPKGTNFLQLEQLEKEIIQKESKIKKNEKLSESPECLTEIPFDKVSSPATLATLEQTVSATIRVYLTHFMINTFGIHGNLALNENNYEELIYEYIASKMEEGLINERSFFASTYEGYTYWLLFLEQCAQIYNRRVKLGEIEPDIEAQEAMNIINNAQIAYTKPKRDVGALFQNDFKVSIFPPPEDINQLLAEAANDFDEVYAYPAVGGYLISRNTNKWNKTFKTGFFETIADDFSGESDKITLMFGGSFRFWTQNQMNFAAKVATIAENEQTCKVFLKRLIREQVKFYSDKLASELNPRPLIYDINKYFIGGSKIFYGSNIRAGIYDVEVPIGGASDTGQEAQSSTEYYGTINHCAPSDGVHPLSSENIQDIKQNGGFYLEKYLRVISKIPEADREDSMLISLIPAELKEQIDKLPPNLPSGVQNINEFIDFLNSVDLSEDINISDWFGNATIAENEEGYTGTIGIKFGVRVCYITNEDFASSLQYNNFDKVQIKSLKERTFKLTGVDNLVTLPLVSYEKDILDEKLSSFKKATEDFNQDLKCFIDGLCQSDEFNLVFNKILNVKKVGSTLACYSDLNFIPSIGLGQNERREPDLSFFADLLGGDVELPDADDRSDFFNDCRSECRKLFVSNYKRNDFTPPSEEEELTEGTFATQKFLAKTYALSSLSEDISYWTRRRIKGNKPTDKDGKECQNQFGGLFNIKR